MDIEKQLHNYIDENLIYTDGEGVYTDDSSFIREGLIDSMGVMELVAHVQTAFGIAVDQHELTPENFDSVGRLASFIRRKLGQTAFHESSQVAAR
ncbi:MAG TPA: acyl carrier protein [Bryobacteraceae bacterium]|nr:acyl carrier protein [Bryobacteraceae bacterium]